MISCGNFFAARWRARIQRSMGVSWFKNSEHVQVFFVFRIFLPDYPTILFMFTVHGPYSTLSSALFWPKVWPWNLSFIQLFDMKLSQLGILHGNSWESQLEPGELTAGGRRPVPTRSLYPNLGECDGNDRPVQLSQRKVRKHHWTSCRTSLNKKMLKSLWNLPWLPVKWCPLKHNSDLAVLLEIGIHKGIRYTVYLRVFRY